MSKPEGHIRSVHQIGVRPFADGWAVSDDSFDNPQVFKSGSRAEDAARSLGARLADAGYPSEITIFLRDGVIGGRFVCRADGRKAPEVGEVSSSS